MNLALHCLQFSRATKGTKSSNYLSAGRHLVFENSDGHGELRQCRGGYNLLIGNTRIIVLSEISKARNKS